MATFRVKRGGSVLSPPLAGAGKGGKAGTRRVKGGSLIQDDGKPFTREMIDRLIKAGAVEPVANNAESLADVPVENPPGMGDIKPLPNMSDTSDGVVKSQDGSPIIVEPISPPAKGVQRVQELRDAGLDKQTPRTGEPSKQTQSLWIMDPANLESKDLDELNVMIAERDPEIEPFQTVEEAKAQLTKDFKRSE